MITELDLRTIATMSPTTREVTVGQEFLHAFDGYGHRGSGHNGVAAWPSLLFPGQLRGVAACMNMAWSAPPAAGAYRLTMTPGPSTRRGAAVRVRTTLSLRGSPLATATTTMCVSPAVAPPEVGRVVSMSGAVRRWSRIYTASEVDEFCTVTDLASLAGDDVAPADRVPSPHPAIPAPQWAADALCIARCPAAGRARIDLPAPARAGAAIAWSASDEGRTTTVVATQVGGHIEVLRAVINARVPDGRPS